MNTQTEKETYIFPKPSAIREEIIRRVKEKQSPAEIATTMGYTRANVYRYLQDAVESGELKKDEILSNKNRLTYLLTNQREAVKEVMGEMQKDPQMSYEDGSKLLADKTGVRIQIGVFKRLCSEFNLSRKVNKFTLSVQEEEEVRQRINRVIAELIKTNKHGLKKELAMWLIEEKHVKQKMESWIQTARDLSLFQTLRIRTLYKRAKNERKYLISFTLAMRILMGLEKRFGITPESTLDLRTLITKRAKPQ